MFELILLGNVIILAVGLSAHLGERAAAQSFGISYQQFKAVVG